MTYPNFSLRILLVSYPDYYWVNTKYRVWKKLKTHYKTNLVRSIKMLVIRLWWPYIKIFWSIRQLLVFFISFLRKNWSKLSLVSIFVLSIKFEIQWYITWVCFLQNQILHLFQPFSRLISHFSQKSKKKGIFAKNMFRCIFKIVLNLKH